MRCFDQLVRMACALALTFVLASCDSLGDLENMFNTKKPLPGERKPVFAEGVPGVPKGIPPELVRPGDAEWIESAPGVYETHALSPALAAKVVEGIHLVGDENGVMRPV